MSSHQVHIARCLCTHRKTRNNTAGGSSHCIAVPITLATTRPSSAPLPPAPRLAASPCSLLHAATRSTHHQPPPSQLSFLSTRATRCAGSRRTGVLGVPTSVTAGACEPLRRGGWCSETPPHLCAPRHSPVTRPLAQTPTGVLGHHTSRRGQAAARTRGAARRPP
jgi:hypothetical protein